MIGVLHTAIEFIVSSDKGSIPIGDSEFFFVSRSCHVD